MTGANCRQDQSRVLYKLSRKHGHAQTRITDGALKCELSKIRLGFDKHEKVSHSSNIQHAILFVKRWSY